MLMAPYFQSARSNLDVGVYHQADEQYELTVHSDCWLYSLQQEFCE